MVDVVVVDVFCALPTDEGPAWAQGQSDAPLVSTGDARCRGASPDQGLDPEACPCEGLLLWRAGARRVADDGGGLAAWSLQDTREVIVQNCLGVLVR